MTLKRYIKPDASGWEDMLPQMLCDSLTSTDIDDFTDSEEINW